MADDTLILTGGVSTTAQQDYQAKDLAPNNYLTIIWKNSAGRQFNSLDINDKDAIQFTNDLNNAIEQGISNNKVSYAGSNKYINVESIAKYLAQNIIDTSPKRTIVNALIGLASGNTKEIPESTKNLILNVFGTITDKVARSFNYSDPHEIFASITSENTLQILGELGEKTADFIKECTGNFKNRNKEGDSVSNINMEEEVTPQKNYVGFIFGLTTSDTESYEISIPRKKVEDGSDYTTHLLPQRFKKEFNVILTNKILSSEYNKETEIDNIETVKDKLIEIANSQILFDIYIRLSSGKCYKRSNVYFSSITFTKDEGSGNNYTCTFSVEPIGSFKSKVCISNRKYFPTASKTGSTGNSISSSSGGNSSSGTSSTPTRDSGNKSKNGSLEIGYLYGGNNGVIKANSIKEALIQARLNNKALYIRTTADQQKVIKYINKSDYVKINGIYVLETDTTIDTRNATGLIRYLKYGFITDKIINGVRYRSTMYYNILI